MVRAKADVDKASLRYVTMPALIAALKGHHARSLSRCWCWLPRRTRARRPMSWRGAGARQKADLDRANACGKTPVGVAAQAGHPTVLDVPVRTKIGRG